MLVAVGGSACGDDDGNNNNPDAAVGDGGVDAPAGPSDTGQIIMAATSFFNLASPFDMLGEGLLLIVDVQSVDVRVPPSFEENPGAPFGCKVTELTAAQAATPPANFGTLDFTITNGPAFPTCNFVDGVGYVCAGTAPATGGVITPGATPADPASINDPNVTFGADQVGRHVLITGDATNPTNNGLFPIFASPDANTIAYGNPAAVAEDPAEATYQVVAGFGPAGLMGDPVPDDATVMTSLTAGGDGAFMDYSTTVDVGDSFTPDTATQALLNPNGLPLDGSEITFSCEGAGGTCNTAMATAVNITTTDATIPDGAPPFFLPPANTKAVNIFCLSPGSGTVTVPAEASAFLQSSGATRVRALMVRGNVMTTTQAGAVVDNVAGHALAGFTTP